MPKMDGTGPRGEGSMTGRKMGRCGDKTQTANFAGRRGLGCGRGRGRGLNCAPKEE